MANEVAHQYKVSLKIPFPSTRQAEIAYDVLRIDPEPARSAVQKEITVAGNELSLQFTSTLAKHVRVALTAFYESLILCCETMDQFGPPQSDKYTH